MNNFSVFPTGMRPPEVWRYLYAVGKAASSLDEDAKAFIDARIAAGESISEQKRIAINNFFVAKNASTWKSKILRLFLPTSGIPAANAIDMITLSSGTWHGSNNGGLHRTDIPGFQGNGTNGYFNFQTSPGGAGVELNSGSIFHLMLDSGNSTSIWWGGRGMDSTAWHAIIADQTAASGRVGSEEGPAISQPPTGVWVASRNSATHAHVRKLDGQGGTWFQESAVNSQALNSDTNLLLGCIAGPNPEVFSNALYGLYGIGLGLTVTESEELSIALRDLWQNYTGYYIPPWPTPIHLSDGEDGDLLSDGEDGEVLTNETPILFDIQTIAALGDSITAGINYPSGEASYLWPSLAHTGRAISPVLTGDGRNFQTGGFTAQQIRDIWLPEVIAASPDACVILAGANNIGSAASSFRPDLDAGAESVFSVIKEIVDGLRENDIVPILCTLTPDAFPTDTNWPPASGHYHPDYRTVRSKINDLIRLRAASLGAVLCDWAGVISTDPGNDTALADQGFLYDQIHPYRSGEQQLGIALLDTIRSRFEITGTPFTIPESGDPSWITGNPYMVGDSSGLATGWTTSTFGSPAVTVTRSKNGDGTQRLACADGPNPGVNQNFQINRYHQVTDDSLDGKTFRGVLAFTPDSDDFEFWHMLVRCICSNLDNASLNVFAHSPVLATSDEISKIGKLWTLRPGEIVFLTPPVTFLGGSGGDRRRITSQAIFYGRGAVNIRTLGVFEET